MQILLLNKENYDEVLARTAEVLGAGGVVMHATDTCYGLAADIRNQNALEKLYAIKKMHKAKPVSIMVDSFDRALEYGDFSEEAMQSTKKFWPGPLTCIVKRSELLPSFLNEGFESVGIRNPDHEFSLRMLGAFGNALTTTSANVTGEGEVKSVEDYMERMQGEQHVPDVIVYESDYEVGKPSTIVDFTKTPFKILREGDLAKELKEGGC